MKRILFVLGIAFLTNSSYCQLYAPEIKVQTMPNNNIGIKTETPNSDADVHIKDSRANLYIENTNSSNWAFLRLKGSGSNLWDIAQYGNNDYLEFRPKGSSTNRMILKQDGSLGLKTIPATDVDLHIKDSRANLYIENTNSSNWAFLRLKGSGSNLWDIAQYGNNDYLEFRPKGSSTNRMILKQDGSLGLKTIPATDVDLHIKDSRANLYIENTNSSNWAFLRLKGSGSNLWDIAQYGNNDYLEFRPMGSSSNRITFNKNGTVSATTFSAVTPPWSDFVFEDNYELRSLEEVDSFIKENKHLPDFPSEQELREKGLDLPSMDSKLLQKIEELTLYMIEMNKQVKSQNERMEQLEQENLELKKEISILKSN